MIIEEKKMKSFITNNHLTVLVTKALIRKAMAIGVAFFFEHPANRGGRYGNDTRIFGLP